MFKCATILSLFNFCTLQKTNSNHNELPNINAYPVIENCGTKFTLKQKYLTYQFQHFFCNNLEMKFKSIIKHFQMTPYLRKSWRKPMTLVSYRVQFKVGQFKHHPSRALVTYIIPNHMSLNEAENHSTYRSRFTHLVLFLNFTAFHKSQSNCDFRLAAV